MLKKIIIKNQTEDYSVWDGEYLVLKLLPTTNQLVTAVQMLMFS